jgi:hypothetical protein
MSYKSKTNIQTRTSHSFFVKNNDEPTIGEILNREEEKLEKINKKHQHLNPKTQKGQAISREKAKTFGFKAKYPVTTWEDENEYRRVAKAFYKEFNPMEGSEKELVDRLINANWELKRTEKMMRDLVEHGANRVFDPFVRGMPENDFTDEIIEYDTKSRDLAEGFCPENSAELFINNPENLKYYSEYRGDLQKNYLKLLHEVHRMIGMRTRGLKPHVIMDINVHRD